MFFLRKQQKQRQEASFGEKYSIEANEEVSRLNDLDHMIEAMKKETPESEFELSDARVQMIQEIEDGMFSLEDFKR